MFRDSISEASSILEKYSFSEQPDYSPLKGTFSKFNLKLLFIFYCISKSVQSPSENVPCTSNNGRQKCHEDSTINKTPNSMQITEPIGSNLGSSIEKLATSIQSLADSISVLANDLKK